MLLQLVYEEKSGFDGSENNSYADAVQNDKPKKLRKNKFSNRLHEESGAKPRASVPVHESETSLCMAIWQSVIIQAIYDLSGQDGNIERKLIRAEASAWFGQDLGGESDFEMVCEMASLQPEQVRKVAKMIRESKVELTGSFNFRTVRKSHSNRVGKKRKATVKL